MFAQNSLFDLPSLDSVIDRTPLTATPNTLVTCAIALMSQAQENSCELRDTHRHQTLDLLNQERNSCILVVEDKKLVGIFTERDAVKLAASERNLNGITIEQVMTGKLVTLKQSSDRTIFNALFLLHKHRIHHLPILDKGGQLYGLVTPSYIRQILQPINLLKLKTVDEMMTKEIVHGRSTASVLNIAKLMEAHQISCVVIVEELGSRGFEGEIDDATLLPIGIITERDIVQFQVLGLNLAKIEVNKVMSTPLFTLKPEDSLWLAQTEMQQRWIRRLVVTGERGELQGLITQTDLLGAIDPVELWNVVNMLQQQVGEKTAALERSNRELQQEINRRQQTEAQLKKINDSLETQVRERTAELTDFIENAIVPMHWVTSDGTISWANQAELDMLGYTKEEYIGRSIVEFHVDRPIIDKLLRRLSNNEAVQNYQARLRSKDGSIKNVSIDSNTNWQDGKFIHTRCFTRDITENCQTERQLQETLRSLEFQKYALDRSAIVAITDRQGIITYVNDRFCRISKYKKEELIGQTHRIINSGYHPPEFFQELWRTIVSGKVWQGEIKNKAKNGSFYWVETTIVPFRDETGKPFQYLAIRFDISDRKQAEESLRQSEQKFRAIFDGTFGFIGLLTTEGILIEANRTALEAIGAKPTDVMGQPFWQAPWWSHSPQLQKQLQQAIVTAATGKLVRFEAEHILANGTSIFVDFSLKPIFDETGKVVMLIPEGRDISDRKQAEENLRESKRRLSTLIDNLPGYVYRVANDPNYTPEFISEGVFEITGYRQDEYLIERTISCGQDIHPDDRDNVWNIVQQAVAAKQPYECEYRIITKSGNQKWVWERGQGIYGDNGELLNLEGFVTDTSDRKQAELKIREQSALLDVTTDAILVRDLESRIQYWNKGAEKIYGWQASETIGQDVRSLLYKEVSPQIEIAYSTVIEKGEWQGELGKVAKTDKEVIVESRWTLVRDEADLPKFILSVDTDITERKLLEAQFLRAQRLESLGTLASGIAHDMNNILTPILAAAQLLPLKLKNPDRHTQQLLQLSQESAKRGVDLVKQILSFARGAEGERTQIQIAHILKEVVKVAKQTFPKSIEICLNLTTNNLWLVSGDATQLHQVLMNLFINARDAMPEQGILTVTAENLRVDESYARMNLDAKVGLYVVITVADTGIGISEETRERIFEPFFTTKEPGKGTGLGLSTVIGIIKSHQGFVNVYSEVGNGTSFKLYLPADENVETTQSVEDLELLKGNGELILVVDDEVFVREITKATLENYNYRVITANDGVDAIALYAQHQNEIAAVLLDLMMPSLDTATIVRTLERINPEIKIIAMSGLSTNGEVVNVNYACVRAFLAKPFTSQKILQILHDTVINNR